ncbi:hypothetical protein [Mycoplasmopsis primatum]|uniref:hypothetical protein n=1 Tax=Mycoplasmopsis primatum TaxID=55604 RepID=UPI00068AAC46|nr:hypothetical protein [Mycoplasmopsis primatum]
MNLNLKYDISKYSEKNMFLSLLKEDKELKMNYELFKKILPSANLFAAAGDELEQIIKSSKPIVINSLLQINSAEFESYYSKIKNMEYKSEIASDNRALARSISFSSNELTQPIDWIHSDLDIGSSFNESALSFTNTTEVVVKEIEF